MKIEISAKALNIVEDIEEAIIENMTPREMCSKDAVFVDLVKERSKEASRAVKKFFGEGGRFTVIIDTEKDSIFVRARKGE